ncbi:MAG: hypothetical protein GC201_03170 [Alphaproteobacteria bacterium]|nr:hypothetical protein [Alphaproteobacteria bacterium]
MLDVLITVDTEFWPVTSVRDIARDNYARCVLGRHRQGAHGIGYQIEVLNAHRLKAVFFIEALHAAVLGDDLLARTVDMVRGAGHEVQLHIHPEWLSAWPDHPFGTRHGRNMCVFGEDDQAGMIDLGLRALARCGVDGVTAFRAGNYGADRATLRALARCGLTYDTSYNLAHQGGDCALDFDQPLEAPVRAEGVWEVPVTHFYDRPYHVRPLQLCACSFAETSAVLKTARVAGRQTAVLVSHGFELMNPSRTRPDPVIVNRFGQLCRLLSEMAEKGVRTVGFDGLSLTETDAPALPIRSNAVRTGARMVEQMVSRLYQ